MVGFRDRLFAVEDLLQQFQARCPAVVGDFYDLPRATVDLKLEWRFSEHLLVEPTIDAHLEQDLRMVLVIDPAGDFGVSDDTASVTLPDEKIRDSDDLAIHAPQGHVGGE
jgi:hypothetical protein